MPFHGRSNDLAMENSRKLKFFIHFSNKYWQEHRSDEACVCEFWSIQLKVCIIRFINLLFYPLSRFYLAHMNFVCMHVKALQFVFGSLWPMDWLHEASMSIGFSRASTGWITIPSSGSSWPRYQACISFALLHCQANSLPLAPSESKASSNIL